MRTILLSVGSDFVKEVDSKFMIKIAPLWFSRWLGNLLICFVSLGVLFLILEAALILFVPEPITWLDPQERYANHFSLGYTLLPNQKAFTHSSTVVTNSYGLRDREFTLKPDHGRFRILCLGDSLTFGNGVDSSSTYPKQLEALLNSSGQQGYEVINAGVPGYDLWQEAAYLKQYGLQFSPKLVIIGFYANDIVPKPKAIYQTIDEVSGFMRKKGVEGLFSYETIHLFKRSRLLLLLRDRYQKLMNGITPPPEYLHQTALLTGRVDRFVEDGWREVEASLLEMTKLARQHNFALLIVIFPMPEQVIRIYPHAHYPAKLKEIAESNRIPYIDLMPLFLERFNGFGSLFIDWDGHPNAQAYKIAAEAIYHILFEKNIVGSLNHN